MFSAVAVDLDGTLLDSNKRIGTLSCGELYRFSQCGGKIILASGRHFEEIECFLGELNITKNYFVISCDGVYTFDSQCKMLYPGRFLSIQEVKEIYEIIRPNRMNIFTAESDITILSSKIGFANEKVKRFFYKQASKRCQLLVNKIADAVLPTEIEKVSFKCKAINEAADFKFEKKYTIHKYENGHCEILHRDANKYSALLTMERAGYIVLNELLYLGDDYNDFECFANLPYTVAMKNAPERIKIMATELTDTNDDDGVGAILKKLLC